MSSFQWPRSQLGSILLVSGLGSLSGLLFWWSIPRTDFHWCAWICLLPGLWTLPFARRSQLVALGLVAGLVAGIGRVYWITGTLQLYGGLSFYQALFTNALLLLYLALYPALFFVLCSRLCFSSPLFPWATASLWVLLEWAQSWIITGFPWELLGYSQYLNLPLIQLASITGVYGLSFLIVLVNATLAQIALSRSRVLIAAGPPAFLILGVLTFGHYRLNALQAASEDALRIGIVQGNFPQDEKWKTDRRFRTTQRYIELTRSLEGTRPDLIIFPETALPFYFQDSYYSSLRRQITDLARELGTPILVGSLERQQEGPTRKVYNRAFLVDAKGAVRDFADKVHLVPFGEYLPLAFLFQYLEGLTAESGAFTHGEAHKALTLPGKDVDFGVFICFESIFPQITRTLTRLGATFLVTTTNDAWFGRSAAPYQHFSMAVLRAVETGRPVVRVANTGISGLIAPSGKILKKTGLFETTAFTVSVHPRTESTLYVECGDTFLVLCGLFLAGVVGRHRFHRFFHHTLFPGRPPSGK